MWNILIYKTDKAQLFELKWELEVSNKSQTIKLQA